MKTAVCTLYEGSYHLGVGALINSLIANGFRGDVYVGFRGALPTWFKGEKVIVEGMDVGFLMTTKTEISIYLIQLDTHVHFTNYKPQYLLDLIQGPCKDYAALFYFDPDIVVCRNWNYFDDWMQYGVAVVHEIVTNDMPVTHPLRRKWEQIIMDEGLQVHHKMHSYVNAGFCGVKREYKSFVPLWKQLLEVGQNQFRADTTKFMTQSRPFPFLSADQDSFNMALMAFDLPISEVGPEGMGFKNGVVAMAHAVGKSKPWNKSFWVSFLKGSPPSFADKMFWNYVTGELVLYSKASIQIKRTVIRITSFLGRFYRRN